MAVEPITLVAQHVFKQACATLPPLEVFSYSDLQCLPLSAQCRAFIFAELTFSARSLLASLDSTRFNFKQPRSTDAFYQIADLLVQHATQLPREDFLKILESAILIEAQYLAQPHKVLKDLIFAHRAQLATPDISDRLNNFVEYAYLLDVFKQYLQRKQPSTLSAEKFASVLREIDSRLCATYSPNELMTLFNPLFEFYQRGGETAVPCQTLRLFLAEKNLNAYIQRIDLAVQHGIQSLTAEALNDLLLAPLEMLEPKAEAITPKPDIPKPEVQTPQPEITHQKSDITKPQIPNIDFFEIEKQRLQSQKAQKVSNLRDVRLLISDDERKRFIKRLFKGSEEDYNIAISAINQMKTWREASLYIDHEIFSRFQVDEFSGEAVAFVDIIFERFQNR